ncbi:MAG: T9SS type A sorting domain-containing protein, partial [Bacteroidetes bacterium]|nr:T9SS type A sorting domain-containing protein [Bacteroidota bacterium]
TRYIAPFQSFFVKASGGGASLTMTNSVRTTNDGTFFRGGSTVTDALKLKLDGSGFKDEIAIRFLNGATAGFDPDYDAYKLPSYATNPIFTTRSDSGLALSINAFPELVQDVTVPVYLEVGVSGNYTITAEEFGAFSPSVCIILEDTAASVIQDLRTTPSYTFYISNSHPKNTPIFELHFSSAIVITPSDVSCSGDSNGIIIANKLGTGPWNYIWKNNSGDTVKTSNGINGADTLLNLSAGTYFVEVTNNALCYTIETITINEPPSLTANVDSKGPFCPNIDDGYIDLTIGGGNSPYVVVWNTGDTTEDLTGLSAGIYTVMITDNKACKIYDTIIVKTIINLNADFFANVDTTYLVSGGTVQFTNQSTAAFSYIWDFGDGSSISNDVDPLHAYVAVGNYIVTLVSNAKFCTDTVTKAIIVLQQPNSIVENSVSDLPVIIRQEGEGIFIVEWKVDDINDVSIRVYNYSGQLEVEITGDFDPDKKYLLDLTDRPTGIYLIHIQTDTFTYSTKIFSTK